MSKLSKKILKSLATAIEITHAAQAAQAKAEKALADYQAQVMAYMNKPLNVQTVLSPEQITDLAAKLKDASNPGTEIIFPAGRKPS